MAVPAAVVARRPGSSLVRARRRPVVLALGGLALLAVALVMGVALGTVSIAPGETLAILASRVFGLTLGGRGPRRPRRSCGTCACRAS